MIDVTTAKELYERYGKPMERDHRGEYVAIFPDGATLVADSLIKASDMAVERVGAGAVIFKIGEGAAGRWRLMNRY